MTIIPLALLTAALAAGAEPATSTAAAPGRSAPVENPWSLNYGYDRRGKSYGLDYRIRWDVRDLFESPQALRDNLVSPTDTAQSVAYGLLKGARVNFYGVSVRPFRDLPAAPLPALPGGAGVTASTAAVAGAPPAPRDHRLRLALDPLADLRRNGPREVERFLLREGFDLMLPGNRGAPSWQKEAAARSVLDAGRLWSEDLPGSP